METEKLCVNLSAAEIGKIDLLVAQGLYMNRSDVVRGGLYRVFSEHERDIERGRHELGALVLGFAMINREQLEQAVSQGKTLDFRVVGIVQIAADVTAELALQGIHEIYVLGSLRGPKPVLDAISGRIKKKIF